MKGKRLFDIGLSAAGLIVSSPLWLLLRHAYRADLTDRASIAAQLDACARLAEHVPVYGFTLPRDLARVQRAARDERSCYIR